MVYYIGRYKGIEKKEYNIEVVTPMFLGGAEINKAELRVPSIKGMLRFWWRATCGIEDIEELYEKESELFGNTDIKSNVCLDITDCNLKISKSIFSGKKYIAICKGRKLPPLDVLHYLAYGTLNKKGQGNIVHKEYIDVGSSFKLVLKCRKDIFGEVEKSLAYLINFGGLGAKSRNGFGSMYCEEVQQINKPLKSGNLKNYTSFSQYSRLIQFNPEQTWQDALSNVGLVYREGRLSLEKKHNFEKRGLVAKPIEAKGENVPDYIKDNRHAKVLFLHVRKLKNGNYQGQILFLPYNFKSFNDTSESFHLFSETLNRLCKKIEKKSGGNKWV
ncbi:MAG: CRISPR-associated protein TM1795 family protein [Desulfonauticus sp. 38_4375]|nr:MAG: CRISPR-associated protein TM1795 family protein [Desulfonauticus sp. 38_4375]